MVEEDSFGVALSPASRRLIPASKAARNEGISAKAPRDGRDLQVDDMNPVGRRCRDALLSSPTCAEKLTGGRRLDHRLARSMNIWASRRRRPTTFRGSTRDGFLRAIPSRIASNFSEREWRRSDRSSVILPQNDLRPSFTMPSRKSMIASAFGETEHAGGESTRGDKNIMGDRSPKSNQKKSSQKESKVSNDNQKKKDAVAAKQAPAKKR